MRLTVADPEGGRLDALLWVRCIPLEDRITQIVGFTLTLDMGAGKSAR